jgi:hypothetical protein
VAAITDAQHARGGLQGKPIKIWSDLEETHQLIHELDPELLEKLTYGEAREVVLRSHGRPPKGEERKGTDSTFIRGSTSAYLTARLARDRPDLLERLKAGEFSSVRAAAREAGIVRPTATFYTDDVNDAMRAGRPSHAGAAQIHCR